MFSTRQNSLATTLCFGTVALVALAFIAGCDSFLEANPKSQISSENFYQSEADAIGGVNEVYSSLAQVYGPNVNGILKLTGITTDEAHHGFPPPTDKLNLQTYQFTEDNRFFRNPWRFLYESINKANTAVTRIPEVDMDEELKSRLVAEARFLRALYYFHLVRFWGDVPLVTEPTTSLNNLEVARTPSEEVYQLIIEDLEMAEGTLPPSYGPSNQGRATSGAAKSLLAKVHLTREDWQEAAQKAKEVIDSGQYALLEDYKNLWEYEYENSEEDIFSVQYKTDDVPALHTSYMGPRLAGIARGPTFAEYAPRPSWANSFPENDSRRAMIKTEYPKYTDPQDTARFQPALFKWFDRDAPTFNSGHNFPVIRYADILLVYAEALNELGRRGEAYKYINQVRERAQLSPLAGLSQDEFRDAVIQERSWELGMEGHRWFDLKRTGKLREVVNAVLEGNPVQEYHRLFPIPLRELQTNPELEQNPGY